MNDTNDSPQKQDQGGTRDTAQGSASDYSRRRSLTVRITDEDFEAFRVAKFHRNVTTQDVLEQAVLDFIGRGSA